MNTDVIDLTLQSNQIIDLELESEQSISLVLSAGVQGPQGIPGPPGQSGGNYIHTQNTASMVWTIQHNFNYRPGGFTLYDQDGNQIGAIITHLNVNVALATFLSEYAGVAYVS